MKIKVNHIVAGVYLFTQAYILTWLLLQAYLSMTGQAWWRKIQILGLRLSQAYEDNIGIGKFLKRPFGS